MPARTKIIIAIFVIVSGIVFVFSLKTKNTINIFRKPEGELKLVTAATSVKVGEPFTFSLFFNNKDTDVVSFDAIVSYDPEVLRVDSITTTNVFPVYTRKLIEDFKSRFIITGVQTNLKNNLSVSQGELAEITATPIRAGETTLSFIVDGNKYSNLTKSNLESIPLKTNSLKVNVGE